MAAPAHGWRAPARNPDPAFWSGRRVLVTGHTGFKGSWLCLWLQQLGAEVTGYALDPTTTPSVFRDARVADGMRSERGDVRDRDALRAIVADVSPEIVLHLAAQSLVRRSYDDPLETYETNVLGALHVLDAVRAAAGVTGLVVVTSDKCYENKEWYWGYREGEELGGLDPYSSSKACVEILTRSLRHAYFAADGATAVATARAGNVIGGGDWSSDRLLPDIMRALVAGSPPEIRSPAATRPWQHVLEPLSGYLALAEELARGHECAEAWNFGPDEEDAMPVSWIVERVSALWGDASDWRRQEGEHPYESTFLKLDASKARARLGWRPRLGLAAALEWLVEWYRAHARGEDVRAVAERQIRDYSAMQAG
jgi:CDP-glucose 4,6-dehydratase